MKITKGKDRTVSITPHENGFMLVERIRYVRHGYTKGSWDESSVWLSPEELNDLCRAHQDGKIT